MENIHLLSDKRYTFKSFAHENLKKHNTPSNRMYGSPTLPSPKFPGRLYHDTTSPRFLQKKKLITSTISILQKYINFCMNTKYTFAVFTKHVSELASTVSHERKTPHAHLPP